MKPLRKKCLYSNNLWDGYYRGEWEEFYEYAQSKIFEVYESAFSEINEFLDTGNTIEALRITLAIYESYLLFDLRDIDNKMQVDSDRYRRC